MNAKEKEKARLKGAGADAEEPTGFKADEDGLVLFDWNSREPQFAFVIGLRNTNMHGFVEYRVSDEPRDDYIVPAEYVREFADKLDRVLKNRRF